MSLPERTRLGPYEILTPIGAGGMGEVYRAQDPRLGREVAIKVLPERLAQDPQALSRFEREAKAVAALSHPNILAIHDFGSDQGVTFAVTELLEGETLRSRLARGPLPWKKAVEIGVAVAEGLCPAHAKGIIHRDLKPENIFLTSDGRLKILDFGLARYKPPAAAVAYSGTIAKTETEPGTVLGTAGYMSPEQVRGEAVGPGGDIFALGCVLYEMVSGRRAFTGPTAVEIMSAILRDHPADLTGSAKQIPVELDRLISHCLEKNPEERFQSARDLAFDLKSILSGSAPSSPQAAAAPGKVIDSIAVLPFANASREPDSEYLSDGITESIINSLAQIGQLRVVSRSVVFRYKGKDIDPQAVGRELNARAVLTGRLIQRGETLVIGAELVDVLEGSQLWGERYNRKLADIFALEEEIARKISASLRMRLSGEETKRLAKRFTEDTEAYQLYLRGRHCWLKRTVEGMTNGVAYFQQAIAKDPGYALAYSGLADCHTLLTVYGAVLPKEGWSKAKVAAAAAVALDDELAEGHTSSAFIRAFANWDWAAAEAEFQRAIELNPGYWMAHYWHGTVSAVRGRYDEAERQLGRAQELEPLSLNVAHVLALTALLARKFEEAVDRCLKGLELDPSHPLLRLWLGLAYEQTSRYEEAISELEKARQLLAGLPFAVGALAHAHAMKGNQAEALKLLPEISEPYTLAVLYTGLARHDEAFASLGKARDSRSGWLTLCVKSDPRLDEIRSDARFGELLGGMGLA